MTRRLVLAILLVAARVATAGGVPLEIFTGWEFQFSASPTPPADGWRKLDDLDLQRLRSGPSIWIRHALPDITGSDTELVFAAFVPRLKVYIGDRLVYDYRDDSGRYGDALTIHEIPLQAPYGGRYAAIWIPRVPFESVGIERPYIASRESVPLLFHEFVNAPLRRESPYLIIGILTVAFGLAAITVYLLRRRRMDTAVVYLAVFAILYGARLLIVTRFVQLAIGGPEQFWRWPDAFITNLIAIPVALLIRRALGRGWRSSLNVAVGITLVNAPAAIASDLARGVPLSLGRLNGIEGIVVIAIMLGNVVLTGIRRTSGVLITGFLVFTAVAINSNIGAFGIPAWRPGGVDIEPYGLLVLLIAFGYFAAEQSFSKEERLVAIEHELETARGIQQSILPRQVPSIPGLDMAARYIPMTAVAGDFYDFNQVDGNRIGILVADVSGHGVPAALVASMVKIAFAGQKEHASDPARLLAGMNEALHGRVQRQFVTAVYAFVDAVERCVMYASAGHPPPLVSHTGSGAIQPLEPGGFALGPFRKVSYANRRIDLAPGDRLIFYTDGITEAANAGREFYGERAFPAFIRSGVALPAERFADTLIEDVRRWSRTQDDDLTVVALHFDGAPCSTG